MDPVAPTAPAAAPPAAPVTPPAEPGIDGSAYWQKAKTEGEKSAAKQHADWLQSTFGTADREQIEAFAKQGKSRPNAQGDEAVNSIKSELDKVKAERDDLVRKHELTLVRGKLLEEIQAASHKLHDPHDTLDKIMSKYDLKPINGIMVLHHKDSGSPLFLEGSKDGTVKALLDSWVKDPQQSWRFANPSQIASPSGQAGADGLDRGNYTYVVKPEDWSRQGFAEAVQASGQKSRAFENKPIDLGAVERYMNKK